MAEFILPDFLQNKSTDDIHNTMKSILPSDIDISEGSHTWNFTRPTALVMAEMCQFILPEVIKLIFPEWSYGEYLDGHARARNITRRPAVASTGSITVTGTAGTEIPVGSTFSTAAIAEEPSVDYETTDAAEIPAGGSVTIAIVCSQAGAIGNTMAGTIVLNSSNIAGITSVTNAAAVSGGIDTETDESLYERISEFDKGNGNSFTGSIADYKRWAKSVTDVGDATVIPAGDTTGLVTIVITDTDGNPATQELCTAVYNYIMKPNDPGSRLAPINANLSVVPPTTIAIGVKATVEVAEGSTITAIKNQLITKLTEYMPTATEEGEIKITKIGAILSAIEGVEDYSSLQIGEKSGGVITWGTTNIEIENDELPTVAAADITLTEAS